MNFMFRMALQLLMAFFFLFLCIQMIVIVTAWIFWPGMIQSGNSTGLYEIFVLVLFTVLFLLTLLLIGWYLWKPVYFFMFWIKCLANGQYDFPSRWNEIHSRKRGSLKFPYAVYKELFEHIKMLAGTLQNNEKALRESEQMKQVWIRGISHDLKTPLTYISGYSAMLTNPEYQWSEAEKREFLSIIQQKAAHLQELIQDLNENIQGQIPLLPETVDIVEFVRRAVADVSSAPWANGYHFRMDSESYPISVSCDPKLMMRVVRNLLVNAVVHNPEGTQITVWVEQFQDRTMEIRIEDNGIGFSETLIKSTAEITSSGRSGLGLSIAKQLIEAHGGQFVVFSKPGEGTSLSIKLQAAQS